MDSPVDAGPAGVLAPGAPKGYLDVLKRAVRKDAGTWPRNLTRDEQEAGIRDDERYAEV